MFPTTTTTTTTTAAATTATATTTTTTEKGSVSEKWTVNGKIGDFNFAQNGKKNTPLHQGSHDVVYSHCISCVCSQRFTVKDGI